MKRYLLFTGDNYYPAGGFHDADGFFDTIEEAKDHIVTDLIKYVPNFNWWHIVDTETGKIVAEGLSKDFNIA